VPVVCWYLTWALSCYADASDGSSLGHPWCGGIPRCDRLRPATIHPPYLWSDHCPWKIHSILTYNPSRSVLFPHLKQLPSKLLFRPPWCVFFDNWRYSELDSDSGFVISSTFLPRAGSSCTYCFVFSVLYTKMHWRLHSLANTIPTLLTILQCFCKLSNHWGTGLPCLRCSWIVLGNSIRLYFFFSVFSPVFTIVTSWIILIIRMSSVLLHLHHCHLSSGSLLFKHLPSSY